MNTLKKMALALATVGMTVAPVAASAAPADLRADTTVEGNAFGPEAGMLPLILAGLAVLVGLYFVIDGDDSPSSP